MKFCVLISFCEVFWRLLNAVFPFYFVSEKLAFSFFYPINLFLLVSSPKIIIAKNLLVFLLFYSLFDYVIFPQLSNIVSFVKLVKLSDNGILYAIVVKIIL